MTSGTSGLHRVATLAGTVVVVLSLAGCGRTLVFAERDGVNLAVRANPSATPPLGVNFGLERVIATIVPPAGQKDGKPAGEAVSMFAAFQVDATNVNLKSTLNVDLTINTQFASGAAAERVAGNPEAVARIVRIDPISTYGEDPNTALLLTFLHKPGTTTVDPLRSNDMRSAMSAVGIEGVSVTRFLYGQEFATARSEVVRQLKLKQ